METLNKEIKKSTRRKTILTSIGITALVIVVNIIISMVAMIGLIVVEASKNGADILSSTGSALNLILEHAYTLTGVYMIIAFFIVFGILKLKKINVLAEIKMAKIKMPSGLLYLLFIPAAYGLSVIVNNILDLLSKYMTLPGLEQAAQISNMNSNPLRYKLLIIAIIAPFFEEFIFRGVILNRLRKANHIVFAVIFQGILFGVYHLNITQGAYAMLLGIVFGWFVYKFDSIWPGIIMHMTINGASVTIAHIYSNQLDEITPVGANIVAIVVGLIVFGTCTGILMKFKNKVVSA